MLKFCGHCIIIGLCMMYVRVRLCLWIGNANGFGTFQNVASVGRSQCLPAKQTSQPRWIKSICFALFLLWRHINFSFNKSFPIEFRTRWFLFISFSLILDLRVCVCVRHCGVLAFYLDWKRPEWKKTRRKKNDFFCQTKMTVFLVLLRFIQCITSVKRIYVRYGIRSAIFHWQMVWCI